MSETPNKIPKEIHLIWLGGALPQKYLQNIFRLVSLAHRNGFTVNLWVDDNSNFDKSVRELSKQHDVEISEKVLSLIKIKNIEQLLNRDSSKGIAPTLPKFFKTSDYYIRYEKTWKTIWKKLWTIIHAEMTGKLHNYAAASDILRLMILEQYGGYYLDTDLVIPKSTLRPNDIYLPIAKHGFLYHGLANEFNNDALAGMPGHDIFLYALQDIAKSYRPTDGITSDTIQEKRKHYPPSTALELNSRKKETINFTDPNLLHRAILTYMRAYHINRNEINDLHFENDGEGMKKLKFFGIECKCDKTWLGIPDATSTSTTDDLSSLATKRKL